MIEERLRQLQQNDPTGPELETVEQRLQDVNRKRRNLLATLEDLEDDAHRRGPKRGSRP